MYRTILSLLLVVFAATASAKNPVETFTWFENSLQLAPIDLTQGHPAPDGIRWSYAVDCGDQTSNAGDAENNILFKCAVQQDKGQLQITLVKNRTGEGMIAVRALGRDNSGAVTQTEDYTYEVDVKPKPSAQVEECPDWDCPLGHGLYLGVEGTTVSDINGKGNLRFQYSAYSQFERITLHAYGSLLQTSLQEQATLEEGCDEEDGECEVEATVAGRLGIFRPFNTSGGSYTDPVLYGLFTDYNIQKLDSSDEFISSYYGGLRFAYNKIRYFSVGYGKTEQIPGHRIRFTGQLPLYENRIVAGMTINIAADNEAKNQGLSPGDSINVYVMTRVDFTKIFTNF